MSQDVTQTGGMSQRLVHPDAINPKADFAGWIGQLVDEAEDADVSEEQIVEELRLKAAQVENS